MSADEARSMQRTAAATAVVIVAVMPTFFVGASGVILRADFGFSEAGLGAAVSAFFMATALFSVLGGRVAEALGGRRALVFVSLSSGTVLLSIGLLAQRLLHLIVLLSIGGLINGVAQPASNLVLARGVTASRQALMFGVKQAAVPMTTMLAGASVPLVSLTIGWRWSFVLGAAAAVMIAVLSPRDLGEPEPAAAGATTDRDGDAATGPLIALAIAAFAGMAAATSLGAFLVESAVAAGIEVGPAGWLQVVGSAMGAAARVMAGWVAGRFRGIALAATATMLFVGCVGYAALATGRPLLVVFGTGIAYAFGWGWTGLMMFAVVRFNPNAPAAATGIVMTGSASGAGTGPLLFGLVATSFSYQAAWTMATGLALTSTALILIARTWLLRDRERRETQI